ncbi:MAG TPA: amidohydrolase family protein, partial [Methylomirabilota bacterium]|nr:amidohydrolase family protein [Methylomirabilota bacterium]
ARKLGVRRVCLHKGLPLGPVADYNHPRDLVKAAKDFPDIDFLVYHAGLLGVAAATPSGEVPWTSEFCQMKKKAPGLRNLYMELGSTFGQLVTTQPAACAHVLGQVVDVFGADHVLWGTDSIWYGTPQWQIEAFRRFEIPEALIEKHGYAPLTRPVKEQIFGLNAARVFGVDVNARRNGIPADYLTRMKMAYLDEGATPSHRWYGWIAG